MLCLVTHPIESLKRDSLAHLQQPQFRRVVIRMKVVEPDTVSSIFQRSYFFKQSSTFFFLEGYQIFHRFKNKRKLQKDFFSLENFFALGHVVVQHEVRFEYKRL